MRKDNIKIIQQKVKKFVKARDWEQFHSPKNLSMSLAIEAAELMEHFQWVNSAAEACEIVNNKTKRPEIEDEIADIAIYLLDFCNLYKVDLIKVIERKLEKNRKKYPVALVKGKSDKYTKYTNKAQNV